REIEEARDALHHRLLSGNDLAQARIPRRFGAGRQGAGLDLRTELVIAMAEAAVEDSGAHLLRLRRVPDLRPILLVQIACAPAQPRRATEIDAAIFGQLETVERARAEAVGERAGWTPASTPPRLPFRNGFEDMRDAAEHRTGDPVLDQAVEKRNESHALSR